MKIIMLTSDKFLYRKAELELSDRHTLIPEFQKDAGVLIYDCDSAIALPDFHGKIVKLSRSGVCDAYELPMPIGRLEELICGEKRARLYLSEDKKHAVLDGKLIKLTSHEFSLLELLVSGGKNFTSRQTISREVWENAGDGLINIYIHYLREKLEADGEKIIISSRKLGYKINEKYIGDAIC